MCGPPPDEHGKDLTKEFFDQVKASKLKTVFLCPHCRTIIKLNQDHVCVVELIDKDTPPFKLRKAKIETRITWE